MILDDDAVAQRWSVLVPGCAEEGPGIFLRIEDALEVAEVPGLSWRQESISDGRLASLAGRRRDGLHITYAPLPEWPVLILAEPFGANLHVTWLLVVAPRRTRDLRRALRFAVQRTKRLEIGSELTPLDRSDLAAFLELTRRAVRFAIEGLGHDEELRADHGAVHEASVESGP